jgi:hypothetical protein
MAFLTNIENSEYPLEADTCKKYGGIMSEIRSYLTKNKWEELQILRTILKFFSELKIEIIFFILFVQYGEHYVDVFHYD